MNVFKVIDGFVFGDFQIVRTNQRVLVCIGILTKILQCNFFALLLCQLGRLCMLCRILEVGVGIIVNHSGFFVYSKPHHRAIVRGFIAIYLAVEQIALF